MMIMTIDGVDFEIDDKVYQENLEHCRMDPYLIKVGCEIALKRAFVDRPPVHGGPAYAPPEFDRADSIAEAVEKFGMEACVRVIEEHLREKRM